MLCVYVLCACVRACVYCGSVKCLCTCLFVCVSFVSDLISSLKLSLHLFNISALLEQENRSR